METVSKEPNTEERNSVIDVHFNKLMELLTTSEFLASTLKLELDAFRKSSAKTVSTSSTISDEVIINGNKNRKRKILSEICPSPVVKKNKGDGQVANEVNQNVNFCGSKCQVSDKQPILFEGGVLRNYQLEGLTWLQSMYKNALNGILADEMGLGKTLQAIALICHLIEKKIVGPYLIIAPLSTLPNWMSEFRKFAPKVPIQLVHGTKKERLSAFKETRSLQTINKTMKAYPVVVTSYEVPMAHKQLFRKTKWHYLIVDEGHRLKNKDSQLSRELKGYTTDNRLLLTGTPLQNNLAELWSLLNFILPEVFNDLSIFEHWYELSDLEDAEIDENFIRHEQKTKVLNAMHKILDTFLLRRVKDEIELNLPPKKEILVYCKMSELQLSLYNSTVDKTIYQLVSKLKSKEDTCDGSNGSKKRSCSLNKSYEIYYKDFEDLLDYEDLPDYDVPDSTSPQESVGKQYNVSLKMQNPMMQLRKIVNHPYLVQMPIDENHTMKVNEELVTHSGKLLVLDALLAKLKEQGHKVLIFSTFTSMLDILEEYLLMRNYMFSRLDGTRSFVNRAENIKSFSSDTDVFAFLISTRAGGLGLNLTAADTVIIYDSDWNPQVDLQAQDRCHRIGQTRPVLVYRLIGQGTIDEKIVSRAAAKRKLEKIVILEGKFNKASKLESVLDLKELKRMLETADHCRKVHSNGYVLTDEELQKLLDRGE